MIDLEPRVTEVPNPPSPPKVPSWLGLVGLLGLALVLILAGFGWTVLAISTLLTIVLLHELGHFVTAKATGMKATEFFLGFGPRLWSFRRGETEYGIKLLPLGGYVRIVGFTSAEEVDPSDEPRSYINQKFWKRILVSSAGSMVHFTLALILAFGLVWGLGQQVVTGATVGALANFPGASPAAAAGIVAGDVITSVNGSKLTDLSQLTDRLHRSVGVPVKLTFQHRGVSHTVWVTPVDGRKVLIAGKSYVPQGTSGFNGGYGVIGVAGIETKTTTRPISPWSAAARSGSVVWTLTTKSVSGIAGRLSPTGISQLAQLDLHPSQSTTPQALANRPTSIYGMVGIASQAASIGIAPFLELLIVINVAIGLLNMLPMLPLDGGHVAIAIYERIRTRKGQPFYRADLKKLMPVVYVFAVVLGFLVLSSLYLDITNPAPNPFTR